MKTAGIIGGIGPESTIEYYRAIIASYRQKVRDGSYPSIMINSIDMKQMLDLISTNRLQELTEYLLREVQKLARADADFAALASNTPHIVFEALRQKSPIPLISIVEVTCEEAKRQGLKRLGLFGTRFTMQGPFYPDVFSREGIVLVFPSADEQNYIHHKYMGELVNGILLPETREGLLKIVSRLKAQEGIQGMILGGTELPLILREVGDEGIPFLDTTKIHVQQITARLLDSKDGTGVERGRDETTDRVSQRLAHICILVKDIDRAIEHYSTILGAVSPALLKEKVIKVERLAGKDRYATAFFHAPGRGGDIQLLQPLDPQSPLYKRLEKRGEGLHHIAFASSRLEDTFERLKNKGVALQGDEFIFDEANPETRWVWITPQYAHGVLIEVMDEYKSIDG